MFKLFKPEEGGGPPPPPPPPGPSGGSGGGGADKREKDEKEAKERAQADKEKAKREKEEKDAKDKAEREAKALRDKAEKEAQALKDKAEKEAKALRDKAEKAEREAKEQAEREARAAKDKIAREAQAKLRLEEAIKEKAEKEAREARELRDREETAAKLKAAREAQAAKYKAEKEQAKAEREAKLAKIRAEREAKRNMPKPPRIYDPEGAGANAMRRCFLCALFPFQIILILMYVIMVKYGDNISEAAQEFEMRKNFIQVNIMVFLGFGFLVSFLIRYAVGGVAFNFLVGCAIIQWCILVRGMAFNLDQDWKIGVTDIDLYEADVATLTVLISMGAVMGRATPAQCVVMGILEMVVYVFNIWLQKYYWITPDFGQSVSVHMFGAYFGMTAGFILDIGEEYAIEARESDNCTDLFSLFGSLILWVTWPKFALMKCFTSRGSVNAYLSLVGSFIATFIISYIVEWGKFDLVYLQTATLSGGVGIGAIADLNIMPGGAILMGTICALVSILGSKWISPFMWKCAGIPDYAGVNNLHGFPGLLSGLASALLARMATYEEYSTLLYVYYPARMPLFKNNTPMLDDFQMHAIFRAVSNLDDINIFNRTAISQMNYQFIYVGCSAIMAVVGGAITGALLRVMMIGKDVNSILLTDEYFFDL